MSATPEQQPLRNLVMRRPDLRSLPPLDDAVSLGFRLRTAGNEDIPALSTLLTAAFDDTWDPAGVRRRLYDDETVKAIHVLEATDGQLVATASARLVPDRYASSGYLHWVGALPSERGRGLGRLVTLAVLHDFARRGLTDSVLETQDFRLPAIVTYLRLGYLPVPRDPGDVTRWENVRANLRPGTLFPPLPTV